MGLFGGLGSLIGSVASSALGLKFNKKNMQNQSDIQTNQWEYQQSHAHQLEVEDLKNAGLNPILSSGASQVVSQPSVSSSNSGPDIMGDMSRLIEANSAKSQAETSKTNAETERIKADLEERRLKMDEANSAKDNALKDENIKLIKAQSTSESERTKLLKEQIVSEIRRRDENSAESAARIRQADAAAANLSAMITIQNKIADAKVRHDDKEVELMQKDLDSVIGQIEKEYYSDPDARTTYKIGMWLNDLNPFGSARTGPFGFRKGGK